jgi:hypothetical protein
VKNNLSCCLLLAGLFLLLLFDFEDGGDMFLRSFSYIPEERTHQKEKYSFYPEVNIFSTTLHSSLLLTTTECRYKPVTVKVIEQCRFLTFIREKMTGSNLGWDTNCLK